MATLCLTESRLTAIRAGVAAAVGLPPETLSPRAVRWIDSVRPVPALRDWLQGQWGMIFSHPEDFQEAGLEQDRWLVVLSQEFRAAGVRPLACQPSTGRTDASWVSALTGDPWYVQLEGDVADLAARQLRSELDGLGSRFVLVVDENLRRRGLLPYRRGAGRLSPLDLAASVRALRQRCTERRAA
jgi:alkyl hydroperoxide reductase subunit AhpC